MSESRVAKRPRLTETPEVALKAEGSQVNETMTATPAELSASLPLPVPSPPQATASLADVTSESADAVNEVLVQFQSIDGVITGPQLSIPLTVSRDQLQLLINNLLQNEERLSYAFYLNEQEINSSLSMSILDQKLSTESILSIIYQPQALFRVRAITHCTSTLPGHTEAILTISYSPSSLYFVSGSGDTTLRLWDATTQTPKYVLRGHKNWVLCAVFSPNERCVASGGMDGELRIWSVSSGSMLGKVYKGHLKWITSISWEPYHMNPQCSRLATGSKDGTIRIWDIVHRRCMMVLSGHTSSVSCVKWGGCHLLYSSSHDRSIKVWSTETGKLVRTLEGHAHWVNHLSLSVDYVLKTAAFDQRGQCPDNDIEAQQVAKKKYEQAIKVTGGSELLVSGSEDFTCILWNPTTNKHGLCRMTGHQQPVNFVCYSPDSRYIATASFDKSIKIWNGLTGGYICSFRGHVQSVYQVCWSSDSRLVCSSSKDSTMKVWDLRNKKMLLELPGHADEVFACDWSNNGEQVASGGKDHVIKVWRN